MMRPSIATRLTTAMGRKSASAAPLLCKSRSVARVVWCLSGLNLAITVLVLVSIFVISERWWLAAAISFLPRSPWAVPAVLLGLVAAFVHRPSLWVNVISLGLVIGPIMELRIP